MALFKDYIIYTHHDSELQTIGQFLDNLGLSIAKNLSAQELVDYKVTTSNGESISNFQRIASQYNSSDRETFLTGDDEPVTARPLETFPIYIGTRLALPKSQVFAEVALISGYGQTAPITSIDNFLSDNHAKLLSDPLYYPIDKIDLGEGQGVLNTQFPNMSVWVWCRSLSPEDADFIPIESRNSLSGDSQSYVERRRQLVKHFGIDGNLIDITPFIFSASTSVDAGVGTFALNLAPIEGERDKSTGWRPSQETINSINSREFVAQAKINKFNKDTESIERSKFLFHNIIQPNDLVFIRFETLQFEADRTDPGEEYEYLIDKERIANKSYDMIGLVDSNRISARSANQVDVSIEVNGRDLMKLLQEDGSYFYPLAYTNYSESEFGDQKLLRRLSVTGKYPLFGEYAYRSIRYSVEFIINQVSNISIVPDNLFTSYGDRVSKTLQFDSQTEEAVKEQLASLKEDIETNIGGSRLNDGIDIEDATGERAKIVEAFESMKSFIGATFDAKAWIYNRTTFEAVGWKAGTYDGATVPLMRYPSRWSGLVYGTGQPVQDVVFNASDSQGNQIDINEAYSIPNDFALQAVRLTRKYIQLSKQDLITHEPLPMSGIWQIVKLAIDPQLDALRLSDPSIAQPDGALSDQMKKICQEPFVEFFGDTYGDLYYFMFRRPPWNQESIRRFSSNFYKTIAYSTPTVNQAQNNTRDADENGDGGTFTAVSNPRRVSFLIDIYEEDVMSDSLSFYDGEVYSFYEISPQAGFLGQGSEVSTGYIPIVQIPEYAEIFGSKRLKVISQYTRFDGSWRLKQLTKVDVITQAGEDLRWMVETNAYLPFTRQGRIIINGDRRIKRGTWIKYHPTGEIFYVSAVMQDYSINSQVDRTTTLTVERGMVEKFVQGAVVQNAAGDEFTASYFNIVDSDSIPQFVETLMTDQALAGYIMKTFVNNNVLNFFLKRNQFKDDISSNEAEDTIY